MNALEQLETRTIKTVEQALYLWRCGSVRTERDYLAGEHLQVIAVQALAGLLAVPEDQAAELLYAWETGEPKSKSPVEPTGNVIRNPRVRCCAACGLVEYVHRADAGALCRRCYFRVAKRAHRAVRA